jgi:hypothetical protein
MALAYANGSYMSKNHQGPLSWPAISVTPDRTSVPPCIHPIRLAALSVPLILNSTLFPVDVPAAHVSNCTSQLEHYACINQGEARQHNAR